MISSFFSKTKPINYLVTLGFSALLYLILGLISLNSTFEFEPVLIKFTGLVFLLITFFTINPILKADKLADLTSFSMLFYALLLALFLPILENEKVIVSNFLILLSTDKVLSLKFDKNVKYKIFEASLCVFIASLLVEWTIVFLIPIYIGVYVYCSTQLRNWLMPIAALGALLLGLGCYCSLFNDWVFIEAQYTFKLKYTFDYRNYFSLAGYLLVVLIVIAITLVKLGNRGIGRILSLRLLFSYFVIGIILVFISDEYGLSAVMFTFFSASVYLTNYLETVQNKRFKEFFLTVLVLGCLITSVFYLIQ